MTLSSSFSLSFLILCIPSLALALSLDASARLMQRTPPAPPRLSRRQSSSNGYYDPYNNGGSMLTDVPDTYPAGLGEPLNTIISGNSDSQVLQNSADNGGLINYFMSFGFSTDCLGQQDPSIQSANLGDGNGYLNESAVIRWDYGNPTLGTCEETIDGGNHFRYWIQDGSQADSGAIFMAVSYEEPIAEQHTIAVNGYDLGRDWLVGNATNQSTILPTLSLNNQSTYSGQTSFNGYNYSTSVVYVTGLLQNTSNGINHWASVGVNGSNAIDGLVAVMTVKLVGQPTTTSGASWTSPPATIVSLPSIIALLSLLLPLASLSL